MAGQLIPRGDRRWLVRVFEGRDPITKQRRYTSRTVVGTKKDARAELTKMMRDMDTGTFVQPSRETVGEFLLGWLDTVAKVRVRERTLASYRMIVERYLVPTIGMKRLARLSVSDIDALYARMRHGTVSGRRLGPRTVRYTHSVLRSALKKAVKARKIAYNPSDDVTLPRMVKPEPRDVGKGIAHRFLVAAQTDRWNALWSLLVLTGLRPGEALALKWDDIDGSVLHVRRVLVPSNGSWRFDEPKTERSLRTVTLPTVAVRALKQHRAQQAEERLRAGSSYSDVGLVFANAVGRPLEVRNLVRRHLHAVLKAAELPHLRLYDLRHMAATVLMEDGEHPKAVSERLGHSTIRLTMDTYSHVTSSMQERTASRLDALFSEVSSG